MEQLLFCHFCHGCRFKSLVNEIQDFKNEDFTRVLLFQMKYSWLQRADELCLVSLPKHNTTYTARYEPQDIL